jgi:hypothetical protein
MPYQANPSSEFFKLLVWPCLGIWVNTILRKGPVYIEFAMAHSGLTLRHRARLLLTMVGIKYFTQKGVRGFDLCL